MSVIDELHGLDYKMDFVDEIKQEKLPLVMWGCGELAEEIYDYLEKNRIELTEIFVDDEYYKENLYLKNRKVISSLELQQKYKGVNIILGCSNYEKRKVLEERAYVNKVFYLFSVNYGIFDKTPMDLIEEKEDEFQQVYDLLADDKSKKNLVAFLKTRLTGNNAYIEEVYTEEYNFFNNDVYCVNEKEVLIDVGAFDGDTIKLFLKECEGKYKQIYALEPDSINLQKLKKYIEEEQLEDIYVTERGAWNRKGKISFSFLNEQISSVVVDEGCVSEDSVIEVDTLDEMFSYQDKVSLIKINYLEGVVEALEGAADLLKEHLPKLVVTVGFDCRNIRYVPTLIKEINPNYKIFLRYNRGMVSALTLYAVVD